MFGKKTEDTKKSDQNTAENGLNTDNLAPPLKPFSKKGSHIPNKPPLINKKLINCAIRIPPWQKGGTPPKQSGSILKASIQILPKL